MHKYEVVYFNISNVVLVYCERCVQNVINFIAHKPVKTECGNPVQLYLLKHWKELERGDFAHYFGRPILIKSISFRELRPLTA